MDANADYKQMLGGGGEGGWNEQDKHIPPFLLVLFKTTAGTGVLLLMVESAHAADCLPV